MTAADFAAAMHRVGPSIVRGAAVEVAPVSWSDVGGYDEVKKRLRQAVEWPLQHTGSQQGFVTPLCSPTFRNAGRHLLSQQPKQRQQ